MIGIYKITSPTNKIYIGQSINIEKRWYVYKNKNKINLSLVGIKLYNSLKKYGWEQHIFEIIEECSLEQLNEREEYWIKKHDSIKKGLNIKEGGSKGKHSIETIEKIRQKALGRKLSNETKQKIGNSKIGNKYNLGRKLSNETKQKMSRSYKGEYNKERIDKIIIKIQKPIYQYDKQMNFIQEWPNQKQITQKLNIQQPSISNCLNKKSKTAGGYIWIFKN